MIFFTTCKVNIGLNIVARRQDGYHDIETLMVPIDWHDVLEIVPAKGDKTTLTVLGRQVDCAPEDNLVMKAYRALDAVSPLPPVDIYLEKIVPDQAGLGGGSADASFTLTGLYGNWHNSATRRHRPYTLLYSNSQTRYQSADSRGLCRRNTRALEYATERDTDQYRVSLSGQ